MTTKYARRKLYKALKSVGVTVKLPPFNEGEKFNQLFGNRPTANQILLTAFLWSETKQGEYFWSYANEKLKRLETAETGE